MHKFEEYLYEIQITNNLTKKYLCLSLKRIIRPQISETSTSCSEKEKSK